MVDIKPVILILGPTAGGKTELAIELAKRLPGGGECICADSMQVYRGMDIGTAKPPTHMRKEIPHHLLDVTDPSDDTFSVDTWLKLAEQSITEIRARGRWPIIVGGTNLYIQAFMGGMMDGPPPHSTLREKLQLLDEVELRQRLEQIDPLAASRIHPNDRKRTIRAIEVFEQSGQRLSELQTQWSDNSYRNDVCIIGLDFPVDVINRRINARVKAMIEAGLIEETKQLHEKRVLGRNAREALGYKQIIEFLEEQIALDDAIEQIKIRTRRFAKHQRTWLQRFRSFSHSTWIPVAEMHFDDVVRAALESILTDLPIETAETKKRPASA